MALIRTSRILHTGFSKIGSRNFVTSTKLSAPTQLGYHRQVLGVEKSASPEQIKNAFYEMSKKNHPDLFPGDKVKQQKYVAITEAYTVLLQESKTSSIDIQNRNKFNKGSKFSKGSVSTHENFMI